ncbi:KfrB domain-containing protein [Pseudomonas syringae]|uniref:KfrB domain-containing protein n=1 Tax=Pseudomonas syringae TaxID=317 RepID=UPI00067F61D4|nr:hypothetical protein [Pseudomonas syringae]QGG78951.1 hypothetical protein N028_26880 [Pseudomonas syringae USA011]
MDSGDIPQDIRSSVAERLGPESDVFPAKENGSYKGPVIHADSAYLVQAVGKDHKTAVIHQRADVQLMGAALQSRDARNDLVNRNVQLHYRGDQAKGYPWDAEKEATQRAARAPDRPAERGKIAGQVLSQAEQYAAQNIKNVKQREAFLKHLGKVTEQFQQGQQPEQKQGAQEKIRPAQQEQAKQSSYDVER